MESYNIVVASHELKIYMHYKGGNWTPRYFKISTVATFSYHRSLSLRAHTGLSVIGGAGAYSSRKGLALWHGQCRQPRVGVPPLRLAGITRWAAPPTKKEGNY